MEPARAATQAPPAPAPKDPLLTYYQTTRQMNIDLAEKRYKTEFRFRTQQYIRGRGTTAVVDEEVCMGCTHCFDNCAFEAIDMADRKFALPAMSYVSRKAVIIVDNCVGCEKCALVCPVDAIDMIPKEGFEVKDGRLLPFGAPAPAPPKPPTAPAAKPAAPAKPPAPMQTTEELLREIEEATERTRARIAQLSATEVPPKPEEPPKPRKAAPGEEEEKEEKEGES